MTALHKFFLIQSTSCSNYVILISLAKALFTMHQSLYTWKRQKTRGFLMFLGGIERN